MQNRIKALFENEMFEPRFIGLFTNPFYIARKSLYNNIKLLGEFITGCTLDIGCGTKPYEKLFKSDKYVGIDLQTSIHKASNKIDIFYSGKLLPFSDIVFDSVVTFQVLEHVFEPENFFEEIHRVLKQNGYLLITAPFVWDEHEKPLDFARYSSFGLKYLLEKNGFEIVKKIKTEPNIKTVFQLFNGYIYKKVVNKKFFIKQLSTFFLMAPITIFAIVLNFFLPNNEDFYLDHVILAQKKVKNNH